VRYLQGEKAYKLKITIGINEMTKGAEQINSAVLRVNEISRENKRNIETLPGAESKFRV
jgi:methyl-accepting chemotaxis protein